MRLLGAGLVWSFASALVLAGLALVLYCLALVGWQVINHLQMGIWGPLPASLLFIDHSLRFLPELRWARVASPDGWPAVHQALTWSLARLHAGVLFAVPGLALMALGVRMAMRPAPPPRARKKPTSERPSDARAGQYREHRPRVEPFIGPDDIADALIRHKKPPAAAPAAKAVSSSAAA